MTLSILDKYKASTGYQEPNSAARAGSVSTALFAGGVGAGGLKWLGNEIKRTGGMHSLANEGNALLFCNFNSKFLCS